MKNKHENPRRSVMQDMMKARMGNHEMRSRCKGMMEKNMQADPEDESYSSDELMILFEDWCRHVEDEIVSYIDELGKVDEEEIARKFMLSGESVQILLTKLGESGKIKYEKQTWYFKSKQTLSLMMNQMMNAMIRNMSVSEREEMMLTMMPEMMKRVDPEIMMPKMFKQIGDMLTLTKIYVFADKLSKNNELLNVLKVKLNEMKEKMPGMMSNMMPVMIPFMKNFMPKMMSVMMPMMSGMMKEMNKNGGCIMVDIVSENPEMQQHMGDMMFENCPKMAGKVIPEDKASDFIDNIIINLNKN